MNSSNRDKYTDSKVVLNALKRSRKKAIKIAKQTTGYIVVQENGQVVKKPV